MGCVDQIFTLKQTGETAKKKKRKVYMDGAVRKVKIEVMER